MNDIEGLKNSGGEFLEKLTKRGISMQVLNKRHDVIPPDAVYIGRPTKWGNPYVVGFDGDRDACLKLYEEWISNNEFLIMKFEELRGKDLVCWCAPLPCHGDILMNLANADVNWNVVARLLKGDWSFGHQGRHEGNGSPECPSHLHHHHDEFCSRPTRAELIMAGIDPKDFKSKSRR